MTSSTTSSTPNNNLLHRRLIKSPSNSTLSDSTSTSTSTNHQTTTNTATNQPPNLTNIITTFNQSQSDLQSQPTILRTLHYLSGPSPYEGLITPIKQNWDEEEEEDSSNEMTRPSADLLHPPHDDRFTDEPPTTTSRPNLSRAKSSAQINEERFGPDPLGFDSRTHTPNSHSPPPPPYNLLPSHFGSIAGVTFPSTPRGGPLPEQTFRRQVRLFVLQTVSAIVSNSFLMVIVSYGLMVRAFHNLSLIIFNKTHQMKPRAWDDEEKWKNERVTKDVHYYAESAGYKIVEQTVETLDGYYLKVWKVIVPHRPEIHLPDGKGGYPVLIQHGLFQSSGSFVTSEERSLAFWLAEHGGYQVYLGNNRGVFDMGHRKLKRNDPRFWDYNIKELALYDLPALVAHVLAETGHPKLAFMGHSQGNATMFCSLAQGMVPSLSTKISCFIAMAPAVYAGPLTNGFPFGLLKSMRWRTWRRVFGVLDFMPIMRLAVDYLEGHLFGFFGYQMFAYLFNWTDANWLLRRKTKMFRFTPSPVSSAGIFWWTGYQGFSTRGCVLDPEVERWWDDRFPPLALYHGGQDFLVLVQPLLDRLKTNEKSVRLIREYKLDEGEHCDHFWHVDAVELCFHRFIEDIESTRDDKREVVKDPIQAILVDPLTHLDHPITDLIDLSSTDHMDDTDQERDRTQAPILEMARDV